ALWRARAMSPRARARWVSGSGRQIPPQPARPPMGRGVAGSSAVGLSPLECLKCPGPIRTWPEPRNAEVLPSIACPLSSCMYVIPYMHVFCQVHEHAVHDMKGFFYLRSEYSCRHVKSCMHVSLEPEPLAEAPTVHVSMSCM